MTAELYAALASAAGEFQAIPKNRTVKIATRAGGSYNFRYADLEAVIAATRPALSKHGLAVIQALCVVEGQAMLSTMLTHASGGNISSQMPMPHMAGDPKEYGALITYLRRYAYCALLCLSADDDLDADGGGAKGSLSSERLAHHLAALQDAPNTGALRMAYTLASTEATEAGDADALKRFAKVRDEKVAKVAKKEPAHAAG